MTSAQAEDLCNRAVRAIEEIRRLTSLRAILPPELELQEEMDKGIKSQIEELKQVAMFFRWDEQRNGGQP